MHTVKLSTRRRKGIIVRSWHYAACLVLTAVAGLCWLQLRASEGLPSLAEHQQTYAWDHNAAMDDTIKVDDSLVQHIVQSCMQQQDTFIWLQSSSSRHKPHLAVSAESHLHRKSGQPVCGLFHIPLAASDRSIGLCTDAALYIQLLGGWITPASEAGLKHAQACGLKSAVMFLEPLYDSWLNWLELQQHVVAVYAPNFEQVFGYDRTAHQRMQVILCKVHRCQELMDKYREEIHSTATMIYTGHTSIDIQAARQQPAPSSTAAASSIIRRHQAVPQQPTAQLAQHPGTAAAAPGSVKLAATVQPLSVLHVRGKSGLKHTKQLLDCWMQHPEWPQLTVIGPMPNEQISGADAKRYMAAPNIRVPKPGRQQGPNWPEFEPLPAGELSDLLLSHAVHVMPSEREGFGHSINEGRAAGAVLVVPDHPPMNELVREGSGTLLRPHHTFSHKDAPVPVLGRYGNISASMSPESICDGMSEVLAKSPEQLTDMGRNARALFEADRASFEDNMRDVLQELQDLIQVSEAAAGMERSKGRRW